MCPVYSLQYTVLQYTDCSIQSAVYSRADCSMSGGVCSIQTAVCCRLAAVYSAFVMGSQWKRRASMARPLPTFSIIDGAIPHHDHCIGLYLRSARSGARGSFLRRVRVWPRLERFSGARSRANHGENRIRIEAHGEEWHHGEGNRLPSTLPNRSSIPLHCVTKDPHAHHLRIPQTTLVPF